MNLTQRPEVAGLRTGVVCERIRNPHPAGPRPVGLLRVQGVPASGGVMAGRDSRPPDAPAAGESSLLDAGCHAPSGSAAQRMYSSSASYSVNSMFDATSVMPDRKSTRLNSSHLG